MKFFFKYKDIPYEAVSEPFVSPDENEFVFLAVNMQTGILMTVRLNVLKDVSVVTNRDTFVRML